MAKKNGAAKANVLDRFHEPTRRWFTDSFLHPTDAQRKAWPAILAGESTLLVAPTGSGKTLAAFLCGIDHLLFSPAPDKGARCRLIYVSPL
ncbi:MAG TPA: DEAD/DEAH box helicase, partial [Polyangiaceae bacterium]|nr:DEAD/DEAH box helicase [Polyangiaceae bacterium]